MTRIPTLFLVLHWAVIFSLMSGLSVFGGNGLLLFGVALPQAAGADHLPLVKVVVTVGFTLCAVLFWWALTTLVVARQNRAAGDEVLRIAFASASAFLTLVIVLGVGEGAAGLFQAIAVQFAALVISYLAVSMERQSSADVPLTPQEELEMVARAQAMDASLTASLPIFAAVRDARRSHDL